MNNKFFRLTVCTLIVCCLICNFGRIEDSVYNAVGIWTGAIIPAVFPYIVLTKYICNSDILDIFEIFPGKLISKLFRLSDSSIKPFICSLFCGYPSGAICAYDLYNNGKIEKEEAERLISFTNNAGPLFVISVIGGSMLGSIYKGVIIYIIQLLSALFYGYIISCGKKMQRVKYEVKKDYKTDFCRVIKESVSTTVNICGFMIVAFVLSECSKIIVELIIRSRFITEYVSMFLDGLFEISAGVTHVAEHRYSSLNFGIICGFVSWSGISVIMQIKSVSDNIISTKSIIRAKFIQSIISFISGYTFDMLNNQKDYSIKNTGGIRLSLICSVIFFVYYIFFKKKKLSD